LQSSRLAFDAKSESVIQSGCYSVFDLFSQQLKKQISAVHPYEKNVARHYSRADCVSGKTVQHELRSYGDPRPKGRHAVKAVNQGPSLVFQTALILRPAIVTFDKSVLSLRWAVDIIVQRAMVYIQIRALPESLREKDIRRETSTASWTFRSREKEDQGFQAMVHTASRELSP